MTLFRFLVLVLLVVWAQRWLRNRMVRADRNDPFQSATTTQAAEPEVLRACNRCGVMVPARSLNSAGRCGHCAESRR